MSLIREKLGILRSVAIYYWKPFNSDRLRRFYSLFVKPGDLCFDIGAHLGNRTSAWTKIGAQVIAVEPQEQCFNFLQKKFANNKLVTIEKKAVSDKIGRSTIFVSELTPTISTLSTPEWRKIIDEDSSFKIYWQRAEEIDTITLDDLINRYGVPAFCKIDVENYEFQVLQGLTYPLPCLSVEFYAATITDAIKCIDILESLASYEYNWSHGESQKFMSPVWISAQEMKYVFSTYKRGDRGGDFYARKIEVY